ncbi:MAG: hypothetical protein ABW020_07735 [Candidatus Rokuibacteriota bacterium]
MTTTLTSKRHSVADPADAIELCYEKGWTDGLPVVPPTEARVRAMLDAAELAPDHQIGFITNRQVSILAEKVAINAVMAGCKPEYLPVVVAAVEALADPKYGYHGPATSTGGAGPLLIVNGPLARRLDFNCGDNLFGPGWRANATVGRAVRLIMRNVIGTLPGKLDRGTICHPGKYSYVIAENEEESPWTPLHVERIGCRPDQSAVTVMAALGPHQVYNQLSATPDGILTTFADTMRLPGQIGQPNYCLTIGGEHMKTIAAGGWTKADIRRFLFENTKASVAHLKRTGRMPGAIKPDDESAQRALVHTADDFLVVAAGGRAGSFSAYIPGWGSRTSSEAVTKIINERGSS